MLPSQMCIFCLIVMARSIVSQHLYDKSTCSSENADSGFNNQCSSTSISCDTFIVYRAKKGYSTLSSIAILFNTTTSKLLPYNNVSQGDQDILEPNREIIIPVRCSCSAKLFFGADFRYNASLSESLSSIACETFGGLVKVKNLRAYNPDLEGDIRGATSIQVPVKCTCPNTSETENNTYMVTYPIMKGDDPSLIARKFGVPQETIRDDNELGPFDAIFPGTTLFIPLNRTPMLYLDAGLSPKDSGLSPRVSVPTGRNERSSISTTMTSYVMLVGLIFSGVTVITVVFGTLICVWLRDRPGLVQTLSRRVSVLACSSPDFLEGILKIKQSIKYFSLDELKIATDNFDEASVLCCGVYRGKIGDSYVVIKQVNSTAEAKSVICILSKIYHLNVLKLEGICEDTTPYLVFEFAENGSLSECLSKSKYAIQLTWKRRMQIIFDIAEGLHYLHYFTKPTYVHRNINSRNILVTADWRAKISGFGSAKALNYIEEKGQSYSTESFFSREVLYLAPEYFESGQASSKMDVYAFGVIILELLSGKEATENANLLKDFLKLTSIIEPQDPSGYLQKMEGFMDPLLGGDYPAMDVWYLALLAKGCTQNDPLDRPTVNDILKPLSDILFS